MIAAAEQFGVEPDELERIETVALELANLAGAEISSALGGMLAVRYKGDRQAERTWKDPVTEVDRRIEKLIREQLADRFPDHDIIGEEFDERPGRDHDMTWAIDPIDGTANFVNGFPLFAAAIGVLYRGQPIVGAVWCSTSHALRAGVYHARAGGSLRFDRDVVTPRLNESVRRRLAGIPKETPGQGVWHTRKTGSAAIECAFVAAGLLEAARFDSPNIWDVAGGLALIRASGGNVLCRNDKGWTAMERFEASEAGDGSEDLRYWKRALLVGSAGPDTLVNSLGT